MKSVRIDDETYAKIIKHSQENSRSITATIKVLVGQALDPTPAALPVPQQPNQFDTTLAAYIQASGTIFNESTHFATVDDAIDFYAKSSKPIHLAGSDKSLRLCDLIEYSDEMMSLRKEHDRLDKEVEEDDSSDWQKLAIEQQEIKAKIRALVDKADNFMDNYQGLTA